MAPQKPSSQHRRLTVDLRSTWRAAWVIVCVGVLVWLMWFFTSRASSTITLIVMAFFMALAIEPIVGRLSKRMPRGAATGLTLLAIAAFLTGFFWVFGSMLADQIGQLIKAVPGAADSVLKWVNRQFGTEYEMTTILDDLGIDNSTIADYATSVAGDLLTILGGVASGAFSVFTFAFFLFYLSAGLPRLRTWVAGLVPPKGQVIFLTIWQTTLIKVGGYVGARIVLAVINATAMGGFMFLIDLPYWLPLALWTGLVAQFVPTVGTYISIALPVVVGLGSPDPTDGLWVLLYAIAYQQIENIFIEPRISARAVDVHPAVSFASAIIGAQLFGLAGATLGVPVAATAIALFDLYKRRWTVSPDTEQEVSALLRREEALSTQRADEKAEPPADSGAKQESTGASDRPEQVRSSD